MDEIVKQALAKWPKVPDCYGWLGLDARGNWYLRDDSVQALGPFCGPGAQSKGDRLEHVGLIEFISRNYEADARGCWYFQNGPQRVYVELELTPFVWRIESDGKVHSHNGRPAWVKSSALDEQGRLYLQTDIGFGIVHTMDMGLAADAVEQGVWLPLNLPSQSLPVRFGYVRSPQSLQLKVS